MNLKYALFAAAGIFSALLPGSSSLLWAQGTESPGQLIVARINASEFMGRYKYESSISQACNFFLKEINPRCPDQRGEISFNVADVRATVDDYSNALVVESPDHAEIIRLRLYYRGASVKARRFCEAPDGSTLKSEDEMVSKKPLFYSENADLLGELSENINALGETCRQQTTG